MITNSTRLILKSNLFLYLHQACEYFVRSRMTDWQCEYDFALDLVKKGGDIIRTAFHGYKIPHFISLVVLGPVQF